MAVSFDRSTRLRLRRVFRRRQKQVETATQQAEENFENNLIARFDRLLGVKRFTIGWLSLVLLLMFCTVVQTLALSKYYQTVQPVPGGIYNEGIVGTYSNANPIYATGNVDTAVSRLLFAGLLKYDDENMLIGDLASGYNVDPTERIYTVTLKPGLTWHDGKPLTATDVVFTYKTMQNPDANSPHLPSWQGVTIAAADSLTVKFTLPNSLSSFPHSLTTGILPQHILGSLAVNQLRTADFNTISPVGSGPFAWQALQASSTTANDKSTTFIALKPFENYHDGQPKLDGFVVRAYATKEAMIEAFSSREIHAMAGLSGLPEQFGTSVHEYSFPSTAALMTFFKTSEGILSDVQIRQALVKGVNTAEIIRGLPYKTKAVREALLVGQLGYDSKYHQSSYDPTAANTQLDAAGWVRNDKGQRTKNGQPLTFRIYAEETVENAYVLKELAKYWKALGIAAVPTPQPLSDFQTTLEFHTYDALLHGISIGPDPDVYAYWDSAQADIRASNRLNFSEYKSVVADASLEAGRTRLDPTLRTVKYKAFLQAWQKDAPALGLYQPRFLYVTRAPVAGLVTHPLNTDTDRYNSVQTWQIYTAKVTN
jgi:peptide/nickel transport system substrate-binding protein